MKSDSTNKSSTKNIVESKTSEKKKHGEKIHDESLTEKPIPSEKRTENDLKTIEIEEYPNYLEKLLRQSDWIKHNDSINLLKNDFENKFKSILEKKKIDKLVIVPKKPTIKNRENIMFENILFYNQLKITFGTYIK